MCGDEHNTDDDERNDSVQGEVSRVFPLRRAPTPDDLFGHMPILSQGCASAQDCWLTLVFYNSTAMMPDLIVA